MGEGSHRRPGRFGRPRRDHAGLGDAELFSVWCSGDEQAGDVFLARIGPVIERVCRRQIRYDQHLVQDAIQETYCRLLVGRDTVRDPGRIAGWVCMTARNTSIDVLRRQGRSEAVDIDLAALERPAPIDAPFGLLYELIEELAALNPQQAECFILQHLGGAKQREIAQRLHMTIEQVGGYTSRAAEWVCAQVKARAI